MAQGDDSIVIFVPSNKVSKKVTTGMTSRRQLKSWERISQNVLGFPVTFRISKADAEEEIETALLAFLKAQYKETFTSVNVNYISDNRLDATLWGTPESTTDTEAEIKAKVARYLRSLNRYIENLHFINTSGNKPSLMAILRVTKTISPAGLDDIELQLHNAGFFKFTKKWLSSQLDLLRKKKLVTYLDNGNYSLTSQALSLVPHDKTSRSSDIQRMLALGRRKWG